MGAMDDFRTFITKGNAVDMAVGIVIGTAFTAIVNAIVAGLLLPLISVPGSINFSSYSHKFGGGVFMYGTVITALITFVIIALVIFFGVVRPIAQMEARRAAKQPKAAATTRECPECLSQIPLKATRCMYCTSMVPPVAASSG